MVVTCISDKVLGFRKGQNYYSTYNATNKNYPIEVSNGRGAVLSFTKQEFAESFAKCEHEKEVVYDTGLDISEMETHDLLELQQQVIAEINRRGESKIQAKINVINELLSVIGGEMTELKILLDNYNKNVEEEDEIHFDSGVDEALDGAGIKIYPSKTIFWN